MSHRAARLAQLVDASIRQDKAVVAVLEPLCPGPYTLAERHRAIVQCLVKARPALAQAWWEEGEPFVRPEWARGVAQASLRKTRWTGEQWVELLAWLDRHGLLRPQETGWLMVKDSCDDTQPLLHALLDHQPIAVLNHVVPWLVEQGVPTDPDRTPWYAEIALARQAPLSWRKIRTWTPAEHEAWNVLLERQVWWHALGQVSEAVGNLGNTPCDRTHAAQLDAILVNQPGRLLNWLPDHWRTHTARWYQAYRLRQAIPLASTAQRDAIRL